MPGIGIVTNPHSRRNRRFPERMRRLGYILGQDDHYQMTNRIEDINQVAQQFLEHEVEILALNGGDGTNHVTLSTFIKVYKEHPLPKIALLRGGTMNTISEALGIKGSPQGLLANLVEKYYTKQPFEITECDMLKVTDDQASNYGFIFGNGIVSNYLELYYEGGNPTPAKAALLLGQAIAGVPFGGHLVKQIIKPFSASAVIENAALDTTVEWPTGDYTALLAATVPQIGLGFRPFIRAEEQVHAFHVLAIRGSAIRTIAQLPRIRAGLPIASDVAKSEVATDVRLSSNEPILYTIDGDMHRANGDICISTGPRLKIIVK